jgi:hypothetical protein
MAQVQQLVEQFNFGGGLNLTSDPIHVKDNETTDCLNVDFDVRGAVRKRLGSIQRGITEPNPPFDMALPYRTPGGVSTLLLPRWGFGLLQMDTSYGVTLLGGSTQTANFDNAGIVAGGSAYIVNNNDGTLKINGSTASRLGTTAGADGNHPKAAYIAFHKGRLFFGNTGAGTNPSRVIFTGSDANPANLEHFKTLSTVDFDPDDGDEITAIVPFLDQLTVFKRNKIFTLRGNQPSSFIRVLANPALGCVAPRTAQAWDKGVMFLSTRGVFSFDGARATRVSEKIDPALNALPAEALSTAAALVYQQRYYLFVNEDAANAYNETTYVFDFTTGTWTKYRGWNVRHAAIWNRVGADEMFGIDHVASDKVIQYRAPAVTSDQALAIPGAPTLATFTTGGSLSNGTYKYKVTARGPTDAATEETTPSVEATIVLSGGTSTQRVTVDPPDINNAIDYRVYGRTGGQFELIGTTTGAAFNDTGSVTPSGAPPSIGTSGKITAYFTTKWFDFGVPERRKMGRRMYVYFLASGRYDVGISVFKSYQTAGPSEYLVSLDPLGFIWGESLWGEGIWGPGLDVIQKRLTGLGTHNTFRVKVHDISTNTWTLEGLAFVLTPRNLK